MLALTPMTTETRKNSGLVRGLGVWAATAVVVGAMIGQSVFLMASDMSREVGSEAKVLAAWIVGGVVVLFGAFCYAELGAAMPEAGGEYVYLSRGLSPVWGYLFGWTSSWILRPGSAATIAAGFMRFVGFLWPSVTAPIFTWHLWVPFQAQPYSFTVTRAQPLAAGAVVIVAGLNYFGIRAAGRFQVFLTALKVATVAAIIFLGFSAKGASNSPFALTPTPAHGEVTAFLTALVPVMAAYIGFSLLGNVGGEIVHPEKNIPRAALLGTSLVMVLYVSVNWVYFHVLSFSQVVRTQHVASDAVAQVVGQAGAKWFTVAMMVSAFGALHAGFLTGPRVPYAMARDGVFFSFAKKVQPTFHTPSGAVVFQTCVAVLLVLSGSHQDLYTYTAFAAWAFFALVAVALMRLRSTSAGLTRPYRVWGYPWTPLIFGITAISISANLWLLRPVRSSMGLCVILLGLPFFYYWRRQAATGGNA